MHRQLRILDLFSGIGGVARGIQLYLEQHNIPYTYIAIDIDDNVLQVHKKLNPKSVTIKRDAYKLSSDELTEYDFIWASPPCQSHSRLNHFWKRYEPDLRLWGLIHKLYMVGKPFIVENVHPYYKPPLKPKIKLGRHMFWSNVKLEPFEYEKKPKNFKFMYIKELAEYHNIPLDMFDGINVPYNTKRQWIRNMVHYSIAYGLFRQVYEKVIAKKINMLT